MIVTSFKSIRGLTVALLTVTVFLASPIAHSADISIDHMVCEEGTAFTGFLLCKAVISGGSGPQNLETEWRVELGDAVLEDSGFPDIVTGYCEPRNKPLNIVQVLLIVRDSGLGQIDTRLSNPILCNDPSQGGIRPFRN